MTNVARGHTLEAAGSTSKTGPDPCHVIDLTMSPPAIVDGGKPAAERPVLSVAEAAQLLGVSEWLVLQQISRGELPHKRCGRRIVLSRERILAWLNED